MGSLFHTCSATSLCNTHIHADMHTHVISLHTSSECTDSHDGEPLLGLSHVRVSHTHHLTEDISWTVNEKNESFPPFCCMCWLAFFSTRTLWNVIIWYFYHLDFQLLSTHLISPVTLLYKCYLHVCLSVISLETI